MILKMGPVGFTQVMGAERPVDAISWADLIAMAGVAATILQWGGSPPGGFAVRQGREDTAVPDPVDRHLSLNADAASAKVCLPHRLSTVPPTVSPTVSPSPSLHCLSLCLSHCVSLTVSLTVSPTVTPSPSLHCVARCLSHRLSHCVSHCDSLRRGSRSAASSWPPPCPCGWR
jgi:hypothetical protein